MTDQRIALVTGGSQGIGLEIACRLAEAGLPVFIGIREHQRDPSVDETLLGRGVGELVRHVIVDDTDPSALAELAGRIEDEFGHLDVLVNDADLDVGRESPVSELQVEELEQALRTDLFGTMRTTRALLPLLRRADAGRIVNVSSALGSIKDIADPASPYRDVDSPAYQIAKAALNAWTALLARELGDTAIRVNAVCPGRIPARGAGDAASRATTEGADTAVWLALSGDDSPHGGLFRERKRIDW